MFLLFKVSMLAHVLVTWAVCWLDQSAPYFPIEISRTATGRLGRFYFPLGFFVVGYFLWIESACCEPRWLKLSPTLGVAIAAIVNDEYHWPMHLFGVFLMAVAVVSNVAYESYMGLPSAEVNKLLVVMAGFFVSMSLFLKSFAVLDEPLDWRCWKDAFTCRREELFEKCMRINYHGEGTKAQIVVYRVTGICQWAALTLLINTY